MGTLFERYKELNINGSLICFEQVEDIYSYFCYPTNAKAIGFEGSIMYCFIMPYGDMVFACNPDTCADVFVYPIAKNFDDFIRLILACGSTNPIEQIVWMDKDKFTAHLNEEEAIRTEEQKAVIRFLEKELGLSLIMGSLTLVYTKVASFATILSIILLYLSGSIFDIPKAFTYTNPISYGTYLIREIYEGTANITDFMIALMISLIWFVIGILGFKLIFSKSKEFK